MPCPPSRRPKLVRPPPVHARGGWLIQIGAFEDESEAKQHLSAAQTKLHAALAAADPFTDACRKATRPFTGRASPASTARPRNRLQTLKRSDFECMALKD